MSISVAQLGARMHYAIPRILDQAGLLECLFTDLCASKGWPRLLKMFPKGLRPAKLERILDRVPRAISPGKITAFSGFGFEYARRIERARTGRDRDTAFLWAGPEFARLIKGRGFGSATAVYGFNTASQELFQQAAQSGVKRVLEQTISPRMIEQRLMEEEVRLFPSWDESGHSVLADHLAEREREEWHTADLILCACEYVKDGIVACGGPAEKCRVVPYGVDRCSQPLNRSQRRPGPLRVLSVGAVGLRKGSPYVMEAARQLQGAVEFRMTGPHHCTAGAVSELRSRLHLAGVVPRSEISAHYAWADIYLLPSLCEGSATSTYEAMMHGLPVICTPHTGSIVRDGVDGYIVPARCPEAIVQRIETLMQSPETLEEMSKSALQRAALFTLDQYSENLLNAFELASILEPKPNS